MLKHRFFVPFVAVAVLVAAGAPAGAQIAPGTTLVGSIDQAIGSKDAQVGQTFLLTDVHSNNHDVNGGTVYGHVASVQRAGQGTKAQIQLAYDKVNTRSGNIYQLSARTQSVQVHTKSNAVKEAAATAGGVLVGALVGPVAAVVGGGTGFLVAKNSKENVTIPKGSLVNVEVVQARKQAKQ